MGEQAGRGRTGWMVVSSYKEPHLPQENLPPDYHNYLIPLIHSLMHPFNQRVLSACCTQGTERSISLILGFPAEISKCICGTSEFTPSSFTLTLMLFFCLGTSCLWPGTIYFFFNLLKVTESGDVLSFLFAHSIWCGAHQHTR